jgi:hypothetical protein
MLGSDRIDREECMRRLRYLTLFVAALLLPAAGLRAQTPNAEQSYQFFVDGVVTAGVVGYQVNFNHNTVTRSDSRTLNTAYSPDQRILTISVTQKGLNRLQDWLNSATATAAPTTKAVSLVVRTADGTVLVRWEFTGVTPVNVQSAGTGLVTEADATIGFWFETMTQVQAKAD